MEDVKDKYIALLEETIQQLKMAVEQLSLIDIAVQVNNYKIDGKNSDIEYPIITAPDPIILHEAFLWHCPCGWKNVERPVPMELREDEKEMLDDMFKGKITLGKPETVCCSRCGDVRAVAVDYSLVSEYYEEEDDDDAEQLTDDDEEELL